MEDRGTSLSELMCVLKIRSRCAFLFMDSDPQDTLHTELPFHVLDLTGYLRFFLVCELMINSDHQWPSYDMLMAG